MNKKILVVEDDRVLNKALSIKLTAEGYDVINAYDGKEGIYSAIMHTPSLIILDIVMPEMSGTQMLDELRENSWGKTVPVILLSNLEPSDSILDKIVTDQPSYYLIKANTPLEELTGKIHEILDASPIN
ncbi:response regulator [Candidatus Woesebacteria bacterium]|nr:response regulator [Candidatus Woesebacteria bacterium]